MKKKTRIALSMTGLHLSSVSLVGTRNTVTVQVILRYIPGNSKAGMKRCMFRLDVTCLALGRTEQQQNKTKTCLFAVIFQRLVKAWRVLPLLIHINQIHAPGSPAFSNLIITSSYFPRGIKIKTLTRYRQKKLSRSVSAGCCCAH